MDRKELETRVLAGLRDRLMTPEAAAAAIRAYAEETNRLNRERKLSADTNTRALGETEKAIKEIVKIIEQGGYYCALSDRLSELEAKQDDLKAQLEDVPGADVPDIHPNIADVYRRRIERLTEALSHPDDAFEAANAIRQVIDRIVITPGETRRDLIVTLHGDLGTILDWVERTGKPGYKPKLEASSLRSSVSAHART